MNDLQLPLHTASLPIANTVNKRTPGKRAYRQRAFIRAAVRNTLATVGYQGVHIRELAESCGVSPQTLYNHFGSKEEMVASSIAELAKHQLIHAQKVSEMTGKNYILVLCDQLVEVVTKDRDFVNAVYLAIRELSVNSSIVVQMKREFINVFISSLDSLKKQGCLKSWIEIEKLAEVLQRNFDNVMLSNWLEKFNTEDLRQQLKLMVGLPLLGAACGIEAEKIEQSLLRSFR